MKSRKYKSLEWLFAGLIAIMLLLDFIPSSLTFILIFISFLVELYMTYFKNAHDSKNTMNYFIVLVCVTLFSSTILTNIGFNNMISSPQIVEAKSGYWSHRISTTWSKQECRNIVRTANNMTKLNKLFATNGNSVSKAVSMYFGVGWSNMIKPFRTAVNRGTGVTISYT